MSVVIKNKRLSEWNKIIFISNKLNSTEFVGNVMKDEDFIANLHNNLVQDLEHIKGEKKDIFLVFQEDEAQKFPNFIKIKKWDDFHSVREVMEKNKILTKEVEFTPEMMKLLLEYTNNPADIKRMLEIIPEGKEAVFKDAVCSAVCCRKVTDNNLSKMRKIAEKGCFLEDFEKTPRSSIYGYVPFGIKDCTVFNNGDSISFSYGKYTGFLDLSDFDRISLYGADMSEVSLKVKDGATFYAGDASMSESACLPRYLDLSKFSSVHLTDYKLGDLKSPIRFRDGASVTVESCEKVPTSFDVSNCSVVNLWDVDLGNMRELKFAKGAHITNLDGVKMPEIVDFSNVVEVDTMGEGGDYSNTKSVIFKDSKQKNEVVLNDFLGEIKYSGVKNKNIFSNTLNNSGR